MRSSAVGWHRRPGQEHPPSPVSSVMAWLPTPGLTDRGDLLFAQLMCLENVIGAISNVLQHAGLTAT